MIEASRLETPGEVAGSLCFKLAPSEPHSSQQPCRSATDYLRYSLTVKFNRSEI